MLNKRNDRFLRQRTVDNRLVCAILFIVMLTLVAVPHVPGQVVATMIGFAAAFMLLAFVIYMRSYFVLWIEYLNEQKHPLATDMTPLDKTPDQTRNFRYINSESVKTSAPEETESPAEK